MKTRIEILPLFGNSSRLVKEVAWHFLGRCEGHGTRLASLLLTKQDFRYTPEHIALKVFNYKAIGIVGLNLDCYIADMFRDLFPYCKGVT